MSDDFAGDDFKTRATERRTAGHDVSIDLAGHSYECVTLSNVSTSGVGLETSRFLPIGESVRLRFGAVEVSLLVRWQLGGRAGAQFAAGVSSGAVDALLASAAPARSEAA